MNWKIKALIQNLIAVLPGELSQKVYYFVQRNYGDLRSTNPIEHFNAAAKLIKIIKDRNGSAEGKVFLEIGTGRRLNIPLFLWLAGAGKIITVDLNNYLKKELIDEDIKYLLKNKNLAADYEAEFPFYKERVEVLAGYINEGKNLNDLLTMCSIEYRPNTDAAKLSGLEGKVDYFVSNTVLEHIPEQNLKEILKASSGYLNKEGLSIHFADYIDHFWYSDKSIEKINFLKYGDTAWNFIAGNKYMYMNRLRHSGYLRIINETGLTLIDASAELDEDLKEKIINKRITLNSKFSNLHHDDLATLNSWLVFK